MELNPIFLFRKNGESSRAMSYNNNNNDYYMHECLLKFVGNVNCRRKFPQNFNCRNDYCTAIELFKRKRLEFGGL